jgi:hypothetical protein
VCPQLSTKYAIIQAKGDLPKGKKKKTNRKFVKDNREWATKMIKVARKDGPLVWKKKK